ncbi:MAG: SMC-Scp complex subunit ScpB [Pseudomonadota bacterium]|nr:SMC-Scp complex subunit ScpB [Pseudomonadota bacterium]
MNSLPLNLPLRSQVEALVFAAPTPMSVDALAEALEVDTHDVAQACESLATEYQQRSGGFVFCRTSKGFQFQTIAAVSPLLQRVKRVRPLSRAALETLSIVAYRQPLTRAEIEHIRGVESGNLVRSLLDRGLLACVGKKDGVGKPLLFGTTDEFLKVFGLRGLEDLPPLSSFQDKKEILQAAEEKITHKFKVDDLGLEDSHASEEATV